MTPVLCYGIRMSHFISFSPYLLRCTIYIRRMVFFHSFQTGTVSLFFRCSLMVFFSLRFFFHFNIYTDHKFSASSLKSHRLALIFCSCFSRTHAHCVRCSMLRKKNNTKKVKISETKASLCCMEVSIVNRIDGAFPITKVDINCWYCSDWILWKHFFKRKYGIHTENGKTKQNTNSIVCQNSCKIVWFQICACLLLNCCYYYHHDFLHSHNIFLIANTSTQHNHFK